MEPASNTIDTVSEKKIILPQQLESVAKASFIPPERHRWNTNEEVAGILIAVERHKDWLTREIRIRPSSGSMLLYSRKKVRYRKDGYCWKKRKDGKTTREDHMKLKVQGVECIYGCYVHSAILPTFHRRCYWLLQNPDIVLVHYLNVPLTDDNKISIPSLHLCSEKKEWTKDELCNQLKPMFANMTSKGSDEDNMTQQLTEETVKQIANQLLNSQHPQNMTSGRSDCLCPPSRPKCDGSCRKGKVQISAKGAATRPAGGLQNRLVSLLNHRASATGAAEPEDLGGANLIINSNSSQQVPAPRQVTPNAPFILNLSQLQGSNGLIILSSQTATPISIINNNLSQAAVSGPNSATCSAPIQTSTSAVVDSMESGLGRSEGHNPIQAAILQTQLQGQVVGQAPNPALATHPIDTHSHNPVAPPAQQPTHDQSSTPVNPVVPTQGNDCSVSTFNAAVNVSDPPLSITGNAPLDPFNGRSQSLSPQGHQTLQTSVTHSISEQMETSLDLLNTAPTQFHPSPALTEEGQKHPVHPSPSANTSQLNIKNELQNFDSLHLTHDEIQKTLCANLPKRSQLSQNMTNQNSGSIQSVEPMRTSLVSPQSADLNFDDAFDILDLTEFDNDNLGNALGHIGHTHGGISTGCASNPVKSTSTVTASSNCVNCLGTQKTETDKQETRAGIANITDFSPEWAYQEGGTKVLVTGPWYSTTSPYTVLFDGVKVPATLVQSGVLRCYCPAHAPSLVGLQVACEGYIISNSCSFEYKSRENVTVSQHKEWFGLAEDHLKLAILERLDEVEKRLSPTPGSAGIRSAPLHTKLSDKPIEAKLIEYCTNLKHRQWQDGNNLLSGCSLRLTLLHLAAALGYSKLINTLVEWRNVNSSLVLEYEVDALSIDDHACTPLMWACARGHLEAAVILYQLNSSALGIVNQRGLLPLSIAQLEGHVHIVNELSKLESTYQVNLSQTHQSSTANSVSATHPNAPILVTSLNSLTGNVSATGPSPKVSISTPATMTTVFTPVSHATPQAVSPTQWATPAPMDDLTIQIPQTHRSKYHPESLPPSLLAGTVFRGLDMGTAEQRRARLMKRTSVEVLPDYPVAGFVDLPKAPKHTSPATLESTASKSHVEEEIIAQDQSACHLRTSNSDPHLCGLDLGRGSVADPMISMSNRDLNSPIMFMQTDSLHGSLTLEDLHKDMAMETDSRSPSPLCDVDEDTLRESSLSRCGDSENQMMTLANQIIAAMPERIKSSPSHSDDLLTDEISSRRDRSSSYSSFSSCSSSATPPVAEDSGISTPLEGMSFEEYRYPDLGVGTPASSLSPASSCLQSPYSFNFDSPTPTTEEFFEYFNAPSTYMEKDFSQLTLSDEEQRRLYEAAKIIQNFYRRYKDKQDFLQRQRQKEVEAAILIQSYYRRYKQYMYYKKMTQAAVLIQSQFRSYYAQKRFKKSREAATIIQNRYRAYKEHERYKKSRNAAVIIQQRFRSHYQRKRGDKGMSSKVQEMMEGSNLSSETKDSSTGDATQTSTTRKTDKEGKNKLRTKSSGKTFSEDGKTLKCKRQKDSNPEDNKNNGQIRRTPRSTPECDESSMVVSPACQLTDTCSRTSLEAASSLTSDPNRDPSAHSDPADTSSSTQQ